MPSRSRYSRRMSVWRSAGAVGVRPACCIRASRKRSTGLRDDAVPRGNGGRRGGTNAQCVSYAAPWRIHATSSAFSRSVSMSRVEEGGIRSSASCDRIRRISSLSSGLPGVMAPASMAACRSSRRRSASRAAASGPWQAKQCRARIGRISVVNRTGFGDVSVERPAGATPVVRSSPKPAVIAVRLTSRPHASSQRDRRIAFTDDLRGRQSVVRGRTDMTPLPIWWGFVVGELRGVGENRPVRWGAVECVPLHGRPRGPERGPPRPAFSAHHCNPVVGHCRPVGFTAGTGPRAWAAHDCVVFLAARSSDSRKHPAARDHRRMRNPARILKHRGSVTAPGSVGHSAVRSMAPSACRRFGLPAGPMARAGSGA